MRKGKDPNKKPPTKRQKIIWTSFIVICVLMIAVMICGVFGLKKAKLFKDSAKEVKYEKFLETSNGQRMKRPLLSATRKISLIQQPIRNMKTLKKICLKKALK